MGWKNFRGTFCNSIHSVCVLQCAESETLAVGSKGVALPCKFRNSATAVSLQMWLATLRNLPIIQPIWTCMSAMRCRTDDSGFAMGLTQLKRYTLGIITYLFHDIGITRGIPYVSITSPSLVAFHQNPKRKL